MNTILKGAAKRLTFSLIIATSLGGCAVYDPGYYPGYSTYDPYYGAPAYAGAPYYVGPPISLDLWWVGDGGGHRHGHHGFRGGHHGGDRGAWSGRHR